MTICLFIILSFLLTSTAFSGLENDQLLFVGDQYFPFSFRETDINSLYVKRLEYLGVHNGYQLVTQFWSSLYYKTVYSLNLNFIYAQRIEYFLCFFISFFVSFLGFTYMSNSLNIFVNRYYLFLLTIWYCINPYTLSLWHGGVYNLGTAVTYSLAPFILFSFINLLRGSISNYQLLLLVLAITSSFFTFWLFAPLGLLLFFIIVIYIFTASNKLFNLKRLFIFFSLLIVTNSFVLFNIFFEQIDNKSSNNSEFTATFTNQLGGLDYQFKMMFSWGIYNVWHPRSLYPFADFYFSADYLKSLKILYSIIIACVVIYALQKKQYLHYVFWGVILLFIQFFFSKGPQEPFGNIFVFFYNNVPFFSVFRTPDIRFGFTIILILSSLLVLIFYKRLVLVTSSCLLFVLITQGRFFWNGVVHKGSNEEGKFVDRIVSIPADMLQVADYFIQNATIDSFVFFYPSNEYTHYKFGDKEAFIGQDLLSKILPQYPVYISQSKGIFSVTYQILSEKLNLGNLYLLHDFPINYIVLRRDIDCSDCKKIFGDFLKLKIPVFSNNTYSVIKLDEASTLITDDNHTRYEYTIHNPIHISGKSLAETNNLALKLSYDKNWILFYFDGLVPKIGLSSPNSYYNYWPSIILPANTYFHFIYTPQLLFYASVFINLVGLIFFILRLKQISVRIKC